MRLKNASGQGFLFELSSCNNVSKKHQYALFITDGNMKRAVLNERNYQFKTNIIMKTKTSILAVTKAFFILLVMCCLFSSCADGDKFDGLVLTDENTGKKYLLKHNIGDTYMIYEQVLKISGKDTTLVFK